MKRLLMFAALLGLVGGGTGCGGGGNTTPEKATPQMIEQQNKQQAEADQGEKVWQKEQKKR